MRRPLPDSYRSGLAARCLEPADTRWAKVRARVRLWSVRHDALLTAGSCLVFGAWYGWIGLGFLGAGSQDLGVFYAICAGGFFSISAFGGWVWVCTQLRLRRDGGDW